MSRGSTTENARLCLVEVRAKGTRGRPCWDDRSDRELIALSRGQPISDNYGANNGIQQILSLMYYV